MTIGNYQIAHIKLWIGIILLAGAIFWNMLIPLFVIYLLGWAFISAMSPKYVDGKSIRYVSGKFINNDIRLPEISKLFFDTVDESDKLVDVSKMKQYQIDVPFHPDMNLKRGLVYFVDEYLPPIDKDIPHLLLVNNEDGVEVPMCFWGFFYVGDLSKSQVRSRLKEVVESEIFSSDKFKTRRINAQYISDEEFLKKAYNSFRIFWKNKSDNVGTCAILTGACVNDFCEPFVVDAINIRGIIKYYKQ